MPNCKQSYFNSKASSVNLRFSKSASLQWWPLWPSLAPSPRLRILAPGWLRPWME